MRSEGLAPLVHSSRIARFGTFEVDLAAGEVRKGGIRVKLQDRPFQILSVLLEQPGQVVTREELQKRLWPADTFVDFEHGMNTAITKLRQALSDEADNPRYIETLPRRGYRFIAPVSFGGNGASSEHQLTGAMSDNATSLAPSSGGPAASTAGTVGIGEYDLTAAGIRALPATATFLSSMRKAASPGE